MVFVYDDVAPAKKLERKKRFLFDPSERRDYI